MKTFIQFLFENQAIISKINREDIQGCLDMCVREFEGVASPEEIKEELDRTNWNISYKAEVDGVLVGCYLLCESSVTQFVYCQLEDLSKYENERGIEGVALLVVPEYRNKSIGRKLRDIPLHLNYDYIWGQHFNTLNNEQNWVDFGRRVVARDYAEEFFVTLMDLNKRSDT